MLFRSRAMLALANSGVEVPDDAISTGVVGLMAVGVSALSKLSYADLQPLLDEAMTCISFCADPAKTDPATGRPMSRRLIVNDDFGDADIEEVATLLKLRAEVAELHLGFSPTAALSSLAATWLASRRSNSETSPSPSEQSLPLEEQA